MQEKKVKRFLGICLDGYPFIALFLALTLVFFYKHILWLAIPMVGVTLWCIYFFRDPNRAFEGEDDVLISPADGKVIDIREVPSPYLVDGSFIRVSIFMNVFSVHVNRSPIDAKVIDTKYVEGKFMGAFKEKASLENEQSALLLEANGQQFMVVQIAGLIARRIINRAKEGDMLGRGQRYGLIRFGSRVDVYLPLSSHIDVKVGDWVNAGKHKIGRLA